MKVRGSATIEKDWGDNEISAADLEDWANWARGLPREARIRPILRDVGSQRDPIHVLVGLRAEWTEER